MIPTGQEDEFRGMFAEEAEMQLARICELVLALEADTADPEALATLFRDAHSLKGAAAVVGCEEVSAVAHSLEDIFEALRNGRHSWNAAVVDATLVAVDALREMVTGLLAGTRRHDLIAPTVAVLEGVLAAGDEVVPLSEVPADAPAVAADVTPTRAPSTSPPAEAKTPPRPAASTPLPDAGTLSPANAPVPADAPAAPAADLPGVAIDGDIVRVPRERLEELIRLAGRAAAAQLRVAESIRALTDVEPELLSEYRELAGVVAELSARAMRLRMVSLAAIASPLRRAVRDVARATGKHVRLELQGEHVELDRHVLEALRDPLLHLVRNAVDHGIEAPPQRAASGKPSEGVIRLSAHRAGSQLVITVSDDGRGIDLDRLREQAGGELTEKEASALIFRAGTTTAAQVSDISGRGVGLDVVAERVTRLRGRIDVRNEPGQGLVFHLQVPVTLSILPCLIVEAAGQRFALPLDDIDMVFEDASATEISVEGRPAIWAGSAPVEVASLAALLGLPATQRPGPTVVLAADGRRYAVRVDALLGQRDAVIKELSRVLPPLQALAGASVEPDGSIMLVLDAGGLLARGFGTRPATAPGSPVAAERPAAAAPITQATVLVVDDALTVRELQRAILVRAGYTVRTAANGREALEALLQSPSDLVLSDYEMPEMDGFALCRAIRAAPALSSIPVIVLTSRDGADSRRAGMEAGADAYLIKSEFDEAQLLGAVQRLLGVDLESAA